MGGACQRCRLPSGSRAAAGHHHPGPHLAPTAAGPRPSTCRRAPGGGWPGRGGQWGGAVLAAGLLLAADPAAAEGAAETFGRSCAGCHPGGGNIVAGPGKKSLSTQDLEANGVLDADAMFQVRTAPAAREGSRAD